MKLVFGIASVFVGVFLIAAFFLPTKAMANCPSKWPSDLGCYGEPVGSAGLCVFGAVCTMNPTNDGCYCGYNPGSSATCAQQGSDLACHNLAVGSKGGCLFDSHCRQYANSFACYCGADNKVLAFCGLSGQPTEEPDTNNPRIYTALGCIPAEFGGMVKWLVPYFFGITGGISFLLMVYGFILMAMAGGDPKAVAGAQETVTSALKGLFLSAFAIFIIRLIVLDILKIPGIN